MKVRPANLWVSALCDWAGERNGQESIWGESDCIMLGIEAVDLIRGTNHYADFFGLWHDEESARDYLANERTPVGFLTDIEAYIVANEFATIGDVLFVETDFFPHCCHIVVGSTCLSAIPDQTINLLPTRAILDLNPVAWRVC